MTLMASDTPPSMQYQPPGGVSISLSGDDDAELSGYWDKLLDGGSVTMPLEAGAVGRQVRDVDRPASASRGW